MICRTGFGLFFLLGIVYHVESVQARHINSTRYFNGSLLDEAVNEIYGSGKHVLEVPDYPPPPSKASSTDDSSDCPTTLVIEPANRTFQVGCVPLFPGVSYVPPGFFIGNVSVVNPGNWSTSQRQLSNFDVNTRGRITVGGFLLGDGFEGIVALAIKDSTGACNQTTKADFTVKISCYPDQPTRPPSYNASYARGSHRIVEPSIADQQTMKKFHIPLGVDLG